MSARRPPRNKDADAEKGVCPLCGKPAQQKYRPFCSRHCADVDLARWLKGNYVVAGVDGEALGEIVEGGEDSPESEEAPGRRH